MTITPDTSPTLAAPNSFDDGAPVDNTVVWYAADLLTGQLIGELPLSTDTVNRIIGRVDSATLTLNPYDPTCPVDWPTIIQPGKTMIVLTIGEPIGKAGGTNTMKIVKVGERKP